MHAIIIECNGFWLCLITAHIYRGYGAANSLPFFGRRLFKFLSAERARFLF
jgi:hypothetical protein